MAKKLSARTKASRANGKLARGRKTMEGRRRSSLNAIKHGLLSGRVRLSCESEALFEQTTDQYFHRFQPADEVEGGLVFEMVVATWRLRRLWQMETSLFESAMENEPDPFQRTAKAFSRLAARPEFALIDRYETRLHRMYHRALQNLLLLQQWEREVVEEVVEEAIEREVVEREEEPNEPKPAQPEQTPALTPEHAIPESSPVTPPAVPTPPLHPEPAM